MSAFFFTLAGVFATAAAVFNAWAFAGAVICALLGASWIQFTQALAKPASEQRTRAFLDGPTGEQLYRRNVERALDWLDRRLQPSNVQDDGLIRRLAQAPDRDAAERVAPAPFGWPLLDLTLRLSLIYPVSLLAVNWVAGAEARVGDLIVLHADAPLWARLIVLLAFGTLPISFFFARPARRAFQHFGVGLGTAGAAAGGGASGYAIAVLVVGAGAFGVAFAGRGALSATFAVFVAVAAAVTGFVAGPFASVLALTLGLAIALGCAAATGKLVERTTRLDLGLYGYLLLVLCGLAVMLVTVAFAPDPDEAVTTLLLFLVLLPLVNALFDYLSIGTTRALLRRGTRLPGRALVFGTLDVGLALGFFVLLRGLLVVLVVAMNAAAGTDVVDLQGLFADLRSGERGGDYWWLYATIFSTLVPTLVHLSIALWSLGAMVPGAVRGWIARGVEAAEGDAYAHTGAVLGLTALATWTLLVPPVLTLGAGWLLVSWFPALGDGYLAL
ncbi:MAG: hypothetical protein GVY33_09410, partial [Alphaproteobacteria bacterium]|nr:hypothetical protein [Alphaproteobacteria bacterium]